MTVASQTPTIRNTATSATNAGAASITLTVPTGVLLNDLLIAGFTVAGGTGTTISAVPAGWTQIRRTDDTTNQSILTYTKTASNAEPASYQWTLSGAVQACGGMIAYSNCNVLTTNGIETSNGTNVASSTSQVTTGVTTTTDKDQILLFIGINTTNTLSTPATTASEFNQASTSQRLALFDVNKTPAGATGTFTSTAGAASTGANETLAVTAALTYTEVPSGGATFGGSATVVQTITPVPTGGATFGGSATLTFTLIYVPTGGMTMGSSAIVGLVRIFSLTSSQNNSRIKRFKIIKYGDTDSQITIPHGLGVKPLFIYMKPIDVPATLDGNNTYSPAAERFKFYTQRPTLSGIDATNMVVTFATTAGTGSPVPQFEIVIETPKLEIA